MGLNNLGLGFLFTAKDMASGVMHDVKDRVLEVGEAGEKVAKSLGSSFAQFGAGLGLMGTGLEIVEHLDEAIDAAGGFARAMKVVQTRVSEAEFPMSEMRELVDGLSVKFGVMPVDEAKALYEAVGAGARDAASAEGMLTAAGALAVAGQMDLHTALGATSRIAKLFNVDLKDAGQVADSLFVASKHVEGGVEAMTTMIEHLGPPAAVAGLTMDELVGSIAQLSVAGIGGRPAMAGLHTMLEALIKPTDDAKAAAAQLGIAWDTATLKAKGLPAVLAEIIEHGGDDVKTLEKLFGNTQAATVAMGLMKNGGADLAKMMDELAASQGAAAAAAEKLVSGSQRFGVLKDQALTLIGEALLPLKKEIFGALNAMLEAFNKLNPHIISFFTYLMTGVGLAAVVIGGAMAMSAAFTILSGVMGLLGVSAAGSAAAILAALWPVVLVAGAVGVAVWGLKVAFDRNFGGFADTVTAVWNNIKLVFTALDELFSGGGFTEDTWQKLEKHSGIRDFAISVFGWVSRIQNFFGSIGTSFEKGLSFAAPMLSLISNSINEVIEAFGALSGPQGAGGAADAFDAFGVAGAGLGDILIFVFEVVLAALQWVIAGVHAGVAIAVQAIGAIQSVFSGLIDFFYGFFEFFAELAQGHWGKAWHGMKMMVFGIVDAILGVLISLVGAVGGIVDAIAGAFGVKLNLSKMASDFRDSLHNNMAKDFGVADGTGLRTVRSESDSGMGGVSVGDAAARPAPANASFLPTSTGPNELFSSSPGVAAASGSLGAPSEAATMTPVLEQIAKNTEGGSAPVNVTVMLDSEVVGKAASKAQKNEGTRSFVPAPVPG